jgi:hypothetical protein
MLASVRDSCARAGIRGRRRGNIVLVAYQIIIIEGSTRCSVPQFTWRERNIDDRWRCMICLKGPPG